MVETIHFYYSGICPYAHRARIALIEANAEFTGHEIDLKNKPEWYNALVNPASKVPAITYGGAIPAPDAEKPPPDSFKLAESLIIIEFIADLFPQSGLLPADPVARARIRFFIDTFATKYGPAASGYFYKKSPSPTLLLSALSTLQEQLPEKGPYFYGEQWTLADTVAAPFLLRMAHMLKTETEDEDVKALGVLQTDDKYKKIWAYVQALIERKSVRSTFPEDAWNKIIQERIAAAKAT